MPFSSRLQSLLFPSVRVFSNESALHISGPKYWSFSFNISPLPGASVRNPAHDKVMRKEAWQNARTWSGFRGSPWNFLSIHPPKTRVCLLYCVMLSTYSSVINRGLSPHHLFLGKLELLDNKPPGYNMSVSIQKPLWWLSSLPAGLVQLCMWLFEASWLREAQEA